MRSDNRYEFNMSLNTLNGIISICMVDGKLLNILIPV
jgi:hypothetical protein